MFPQLCQCLESALPALLLIHARTQAACASTWASGRPLAPHCHEPQPDEEEHPILEDQHDSGHDQRSNIRMCAEEQEKHTNQPQSTAEKELRPRSPGKVVD